MAVPPGDVAADHAGLLAVAGVVGAVEGEVAQRGELGLDPVEPGAVERHVGELDVVRRRPVADPGVGLGGQVRAEVVEHDRDPHLGRVQRAQVAAEREELGAALAGLDVPVEPVGGQVVAGQQVPHPVRAGCRSPAGAAAAARPGRPCRPRPAPTACPGWGCRFSGPNSSMQITTVGSPGPGVGFAVGDRVELEHPVLLGFVVGSLLVLQVLTAWKRDALLAEQRPQALVADVVDHPLGDQEVGQLRQAPGRERQVVIGRPGQRDLLDLPPAAAA